MTTYKKFGDLNISGSYLNYFQVSGLQLKKSKCLGLTKQNANLAVLQSLKLTIRHPYTSLILAY